MHRRPRSWLLGLLTAIALLSTPPAAAEAAPRLALVIGDAAYPARPLATAANDAALVAQALAQAGFDVTAARDLDAAGTRAAFTAFADATRAAGPDATILVYLSGYGVQYGDDNYLVPVDARLVHDDDVPKETASLGDLARMLAAIPARARLLVYDLARANPFATADEMPLADGLALAPPPKDTLVAFNAAPGMAAPPTALPYGAYARALAEMIGTPGLSPGILFDRVRLRVGELTDGTQVPWDDGTVDAAPLLADGHEPPPSSAKSIDAIPVDALSPDIAYSAVVARDGLPGYAEFLRTFADGPSSTRVRTLLGVRREALIWQAAAQSSDPRALWTYMRRYPRGPHLFDARRRLAALKAPLEPPPRFDIVAFPNLPPPSAEELKLVAAPLEAMRALPPIPSPPAALLQPADADYYDALPPPAPAPAAGLLPIAAPLPYPADLSGGDGRITQAPPGKEPTSTQTARAQSGAVLTLADSGGLIAEIVAKTAADGSRTVLETDAKKTVLSRTTILRTADGLTMVQTGANGGILYGIATRTDPEGARITLVTSGQGDVLATWRRDTQGIVVARDERAVVPGAAKAEPASPAPALKGRLPPPQMAREPMVPPTLTAEDIRGPMPPRTSAAPPLLARPTKRPETSVQVQPAPALPPLPLRPVLPTVQLPPQVSGPLAEPVAHELTEKAETAKKPEAVTEARAASALPLPPRRPSTLQPTPKPAQKAKEKHASREKQAPKEKHPPAAKPAPKAAAKHAPAPHKPAPHTGKPKASAPHRKTGRR